jgi:hypothetical protein
MYINLNIEMIKILKISLEVSTGNDKSKTKEATADEKDIKSDTDKPKQPSSRQ